MSPLIAVFKFWDEKRNTLAQTADAVAMADVLSFAGGNPLLTNTRTKLKFGDVIKTFDIINIEIYPYQSKLPTDGAEYMLENKDSYYNCEIFIHLKEV